MWHDQHDMKRLVLMFWLTGVCIENREVMQSEYQTPFSHGNVLCVHSCETGSHDSKADKTVSVRPCHKNWSDQATRMWKTMNNEKLVCVQTCSLLTEKSYTVKCHVVTIMGVQI